MRVRSFEEVISHATRVVLYILATLLLGMEGALAAAPTLFSESSHQSPVRGDPGDLLMIPGYGFAATDTVVYQSIADTTAALVTPTTVPSSNTATSGVAQVVSTLNVPHSLTVKLTSVMTPDQSYAIWVRNASGQWSNSIKINDARPLWFTPAYGYTTAQVANLPRYLKVVGRNLQPAMGATTQVKLIGPTTYTLTAANDGSAATAIERYAAKVDLPTTMVAGTYKVQVRRDGTSWVPVSGNPDFVVSANPTPLTVFDVSNSAYGGCAANDGNDDTACIVAAINAAQAAGGGNVRFGAGTWDLMNSSVSGVTYFGILVPVGVSLTGAGSASTTLLMGTAWAKPSPAFTVQGYNTVKGFRFKSARTYTPADIGSSAFIKLGLRLDAAQAYHSTDPLVLSYVVITQNIFDKTYMGLYAQGLPEDNVFITYNEFGTYMSGLGVQAGSADVLMHLRDSVFAFNTFKPGSYVDPSIDQGTTASGLEMGVRVDFSNNVADGTSTQYLQDPVNDAKGWRGGFLFQQNNNVEGMLVSKNTATCTGDKVGDGEAIMFDGEVVNPLGAARGVISATATTITLPGPLLTTHYDAPITPNTHWLEHWIVIAQGPGRGQARKIVSYTDAAASTVTFTVSPAWDVVPQTSSIAVSSRQYWQLYIVDNTIDQRTPTCTKLNVTKPSGGAITLWGSTVDSVVEGNKQYDTNGILISSGYSVRDTTPGINTYPGAKTQLFNEFRNNIVDHEYDWDSDCSWSGISMWGGSGPNAPITPPQAYGNSISHNTVTHADGLNTGAIDLNIGWYSGPAPGTWNLIDNTLVFDNTLADMAGSQSGATPTWPSSWPCAHRGGARVSEFQYNPTIWHTVLSDNSCPAFTTAFRDNATMSQRVCSAQSASDSCECSAYVQGTSAAPQTPQSSVSASYPLAQTAHNLNLVVVGWRNTTATVTSVRGTSTGTTNYTLVGTTTSAGNATQAIYYLRDIPASGLNTITVAFSAAVPFADVRVAEYSGLDTANPLDASSFVAASGTNNNPNSRWMSTSNPNNLLVAADYAQAATTGAGSGFTQRLLSSPNGNILQDRVVSDVKAYNSSTTLASSGWWVMQLVGFKMAGGGGANTQALTVPGSFAASATSSTQIRLTWTASTGNVGVSGYLVERCGGAACVDFQQTASVTGASYNDNSVVTGSTYRYRIRSYDVASVKSSYTAIMSATTP